MKRYLLSIIVLTAVTVFNLIPANGRTLRVTVFSNKNVPVKQNEATVSIYSLPDTALVNMKPTISDGTVSFDVDDNAGYHLLSQSPVYGDLETYSAPSQDEISIRYTEKYEDLSDVIVQSTKPYLSREAGKFIFDPSIYWNASIDGTSLLQKTPLVTIENDMVSIFGVGEAKIYINGHDPKMTVDQILQKLKSLRPEYIKKIELITNPGSGQSSSSRGGIINIRIDDPTQGFRGSANLTIYTENRVTPRISFTGNYTKGKFNSSLIVSYQNGGAKIKNKNEYEFKLLDYKEYNESYRKSNINRLNTQYDLNHTFGKTKIGFYAGLSATDFHATASILQTVIDSNDIISGNNGIHSEAMIKEINPFYINLLKGGCYMETNIGDKGSKLDISVDLKHHTDREHYQYDFSNEITETWSKYKVQEVDACVDYKHVFKTKSHINLGYEYYFSDARFNNITNAAPENFNVKDHNHALYGNYFLSWNNHISTSIG